MKIFSLSNIVVPSWSNMTMNTKLFRKIEIILSLEQSKKNDRLENMTDHENLKKAINIILWKKGYWQFGNQMLPILWDKRVHFVAKKGIRENFPSLRTKDWKCRISHWKFLLPNKLIRESVLKRGRTKIVNFIKSKLC